MRLPTFPAFLLFAHLTCVYSTTITCPADVRVECDDDESSANTGVATATSSVVIVINESDSVEPGTCPQKSDITRTWSATDELGNELASCTQVVTVVDMTAPLFDVIPPSEEVDCSGAQWTQVGSGSSALSCPGPLQTSVPPVPEVTATDNCDEDVDPAFSETQRGECPGVTVREWDATDDCGNGSELIQLVVQRKACVNTERYWKGRPEEWLTPFGPVTEFELGCAGDTTSAADALLIVNDGVGSQSDWTVKIAKELIAAILNVSQGADDTCAAEAIQDARKYLCAVPIGSNARGSLKGKATSLRKDLQDYNNGKCCAPKCPSA